MESLLSLEIKLELLRCSYWEHFKIYNDKSMQGPWWDTRQKEMDAEIKTIVSEMDAIRIRIEKFKKKSKQAK